MALSKQAIKEKEYNFFTNARRKFGRSLAFFYTCIYADIPFVLLAIPPESDNAMLEWREYNEGLITMYKAKYPMQNITDFSFLDGQTDVLEVYGTRMSASDFAKMQNIETNAEESRTGTQKQRQKWGVGNPQEPYTVADYKRLDQLYETFMERVKSNGGEPDGQQEYIVTDVSMMALQKEKYQAMGDIKNASQLSKMIQDALASENLRKRDKQLVETEHIDTITERLEQAGLMLSLEEVQEALLRRLGALGGKPSHKYRYTFDAADQMIQAIVNAMRWNNGEPEYGILPDEYRLDDNVAAEFADKPNKAEQEAYNEIGIVRMPKVKKDGDSE